MPKSRLKHIPGHERLWGIPDTLSFFTSPGKLQEKKRKKYGDIFRTSFLGRPIVTLMPKDATRFLLVENPKIFNSREPWEMVLKDLFPNGLMLMDGDRHKFHRSIVAEAFKKGPMEGYLKLMRPIVEGFMEKLSSGEVLLFPQFKTWTLEIALKVFFGLDTGSQLPQINRAVSRIVKASTAFPIKLPFTTYGKGMSARKELVDFFRSLVQEKKQDPGEDLFSRLCVAKNEEGEMLDEQQVIDHLIFILMAAHDTTASTLTSLSYFLAKHPDWQAKCREEVQNFFRNKAEFSVRDLREMEQLGLAIKETLRIYPPLVTVSRKCTEAVAFGGYDFPAGTFMSTPFGFHHMNPDVWDEPEHFDPLRFTKERKEHMRCPYAYSPFGAGIHHCIGFAFAEMQIKLIMSQFLLHVNWSVPKDYQVPMRPVPIQEPEDGLPVQIQLRRK
ncbi:MAG: cytochrome P450 [Bacteroidota bacterium]